MSYWRHYTEWPFNPLPLPSQSVELYMVEFSGSADNEANNGSPMYMKVAFDF